MRRLARSAREPRSRAVPRPRQIELRLSPKRDAALADDALELARRRIAEELASHESRVKSAVEAAQSEADQQRRAVSFAAKILDNVMVRPSLQSRRRAHARRAKQVAVRNVHVSFVDDASIPGRCIRAGVRVSELSMHTEGPDGRQAFVVDARSISKVLEHLLRARMLGR